METRKRPEIYLNLPPYLREWYQNLCCQHSGSAAIKLPKGSIESKMLRVGLRPPRAGEEIQCRCPEGWTAVEIPTFPGIDLSSCNYLPQRVRVAIESVIRQRFDISLWQLINDVEFGLIPQKDAVEMMMEIHGISDTPTNTEAVKARMERLRRRYDRNRRQRQHRREKNKKNDGNLTEITPEI